MRLLSSFITMDRFLAQAWRPQAANRPEGIQINEDAESSTLSTAQSGETPTDPFGDTPDEIQRLLDAADSAAYDLIYGRLPSEL